MRQFDSPTPNTPDLVSTWNEKLRPKARIGVAVGAGLIAILGIGSGGQWLHHNSERVGAEAGGANPDSPVVQEYRAKAQEDARKVRDIVISEAIMLPTLLALYRRRGDEKPAITDTTLPVRPSELAGAQVADAAATPGAMAPPAASPEASTPPTV